MIYRKHGHTIRWENGARIEVTESGAAWEEGERFICEPASTATACANGLECGDRSHRFDSLRSGSAPRESGGSAAEKAVTAVTALQTIGVVVERWIAVEGVAVHQYGDRTWSERTQRLHVALTHDRERALIDQAHFDTTPIQRIAAALARAEPEREAPPRLRLAENVTAALLPTLLDLAPPNVRILQTAGGIDGRGEEIVEAAKEWPNWYRPSYRIRPVRAPLNLRIECDVTRLDPSRPVAIALLAPVTGLTLRVLVEEGMRAYPATVRITRIDAVSNERTWYPYGAGSFGAEMML